LARCKTAFSFVYICSLINTVFPRTVNAFTEMFVGASLLESYIILSIVLNKAVGQNKQQQLKASWKMSQATNSKMNPGEKCYMHCMDKLKYLHASWWLYSCFNFCLLLSVFN